MLSNHTFHSQTLAVVNMAKYLGVTLDTKVGTIPEEEEEEEEEEDQEAMN